MNEFELAMEANRTYRARLHHLATRTMGLGNELEKIYRNSSASQRARLEVILKSLNRTGFELTETHRLIANNHEALILSLQGFVVIPEDLDENESDDRSSQSPLSKEDAT